MKIKQITEHDSDWCNVEYEDGSTELVTKEAAEKLKKPTKRKKKDESKSEK